MQIIPAAQRYHFDGGWLSALWLFSFDHYHDPSNIHFGALRVFNHDRVAGGAGFPTHSHREMEIVTWVLEGALAHRDSTGGEGIIHAGEVQRMSAGSGIAHSEMNADPDKPVRLLQMWVFPERRGITPSYEQRRFSLEERRGRLLPIASGASLPGAVKVHQDVTFFVSRLLPGESVVHNATPGRRVFLYVIEGEISLNGRNLDEGDQARLSVDGPLSIEAARETELILIDLA